MSISNHPQTSWISKSFLEQNTCNVGTCHHIGVSKNSGIPKWMVYNIMENPIKMDDLGVPLFLETSICHPNRNRRCKKWLFYSCRCLLNDWGNDWETIPGDSGGAKGDSGGSLRWQVDPRMATKIKLPKKKVWRNTYPNIQIPSLKLTFSHPNMMVSNRNLLFPGVYFQVPW